MAYAHAEDNVCMTAQQLATVRGERSRRFGGSATALLGRRVLPNEQVDFFIAAHMDDAALAASWGRASADTQAMMHGYVAGHNRYLQDKAAELPNACKGQPWVQPMTTTQGHRLTEVANVQAGIGALAVTDRGLRIDYGPSYLQTVTFDARGPVARGLLTYGQSINPASPHANDQMKLYSAKQWPTRPFHADDVAQQRVGEVLRLTRP